MGQKQSIATSTEEPVNIIGEFPGIDITDETIFPPAVLKELANAMTRFPATKSYMFAIFPKETQLVKWLRSPPSFFGNMKPPSSVSLNTLLMRFRKNQKGGAGMSKDNFIYAMYNLCHTSNLGVNFIADVLERRADYILLVISKQGKIIAFTLLGRDIEQPQTHFHEYVICTGPRKAGLGSTMMKTIVDFAKSLGFSYVTLGAASAEPFHTKQGFVETGRETDEGKEMILTIPQRGGKTRRRRRR